MLALHTFTFRGLFVTSEYAQIRKIKSTLSLFTLAASLSFACSAPIETNQGQALKLSGSPIFEGWYADPEGIIFGDEYWIYPTFSPAFEAQLHFDAFSSKELVSWEKHDKILTNKEIT